MDALRQRAEGMALIRSFFTRRGYLEVETPIMGAYGVTDVYLESIEAHGLGKTYYLQTSPEYHMKRLLAAGSGPIFQLARAFRNDEVGRWHNPEFTMLEWYRPGINHHDMLHEIDAFLQVMLSTKPLVIKTYREAFEAACAINPFVSTFEELNAVLHRFALSDVLAHDESDKDQALFLLMSHVVEPFLCKLLDAPVALIDFPETQAALAKVCDGVAERFEVYYQGVELANGFHELTDAAVQKARFDDDRLERKRRGLTVPNADTRLLEAMEHGLPQSCGVALGVDRLLALRYAHACLREGLAFDISIA